MGNVTQLKADFVGKDINALPLENQVRKALHFNASFSCPVMQEKEGVNVQAFYKRYKVQTFLWRQNGAQPCKIILYEDTYKYAAL